MPAHSKRQQATYESTTPTVAAATSSGSESLADSAATRFVPPATYTSTTTTDTSSYQSVLDIWQYIILVVVILGAVALGSTVCIFRKKSRIARARRAARQAAAAEAEGADDLSLRSRGGAAAHWDDLEDAVSMSELQSTHAREEMLPPPAYQERRRSSGLSSFVTTATTSDTNFPSRPSTGNRSRSSFTSQLKRFPSAIGSFLNKRVQPTLGGTSVSTDELQTRSAEAQLEAARRRRPSQATPRRSSSSSSVFAFSPRRTSSSGEVSTSRLQVDPPSVDTLEQVQNIRRALSDAGLLFAPPRSLSDRRLSIGSLSGATAAGGNRPAVLATMHEGLRASDRSAEQEEDEVERELARQERRARRRRRRERERQRAEDEAGLPTYSREVAEGEAVLERAEGWKSEEEDEEEEERSDRAEHERGIRRSEEEEEEARAAAVETALLPPDPGPDGHSR
ncbi:hypothetical protein JCM10908_005891 [Rhodotorula pacifica]|uniref:uncharacterized protein n=1 Tax=Rhodotorula pacifica TaxID=1495444 RepID=UPI003177F381